MLPDNGSITLLLLLNVRLNI